jgi:nucleoside-diphosphate-sugar epimerase
MKVLVTGATGFIGSFLAEALVEKGHEVTCLVRETSALQWIEHLAADYLYCDLENIGTRQEEIEKFDCVFHVAGLTKAASERDFFHANAECTRRLIRVVADACPGLKRFVLVSSLAAAGPLRGGASMDEDSPALPVSAYGRSKLEAEEAVLAYRDRLPVTIIRPPAVYGPRDKDFLLVFKAVQRGFFPYWGKCRYSLIYVDDLVRGMIEAAEKSAGEGRLFFLSDGKVYTNDDILREMSAALDRKAFRLWLPRPLMPILAFLGQKIQKKGIINPDKIREIRYPDWICDSSRSEREIGFHPEVMLGEGVRWTANWYKIHRWL